MPTHKATVSATIDKNIKSQAEAALRAQGLSMSDYIRHSLTELADKYKTETTASAPASLSKAWLNKWHQEIDNFIGGNAAPWPEDEKKAFFDNI